jgi:N-acetylmuramoyl-L-alanine amidase
MRGLRGRRHRPGGMTARVAVCTALALLLPVAALAWPKLTLRYPDGHVGPGLPLQRLEDSSDEVYVPANGLCSALDLETFWRPETRKLVIKVEERKITVTVGSRLVLDGDNEVLLRVPVHYLQGTVMLPLEFIDRVLTPALGPTARLDREGPDLILGPSNSDVLGIEYRETMDGTEVRFRLAKPLRYRVQATSDEVVRVMLAEARIDPMTLAADQPAPLVRNVRAEQSGRNAAIYLTVEPPLAGVASRGEDDGLTLVVSLRPDESRKPESKQPAYVRPLVELPTAAADSFDLVALDAGHGGFDPGVRAGGRVEKDVTLDLAWRLRPILEQTLGVRVLLLRANDETMSAQSRAEIANRAGADALITLHCNGAFDSKARGFEVLYPTAPPTPQSETALASIRTGIADFNPWDTSYAGSEKNSAVLAGYLDAELGRVLGSPNRGSRPEPVELLLAATMPSAQVEVGFLTDPQEAANFETDEFVTHLGEGIAAALRRYAAQLHH